MQIEYAFSLSTLIIVLLALILISAFFSSSETALMVINRYKLRHLAKNKHHRGAYRVLKLLTRTDRLLSVILIGNTIANICASVVATLIGAHFYGDKGILIATVVLTLIVLIFAEIGPKTLAARYAQRYALIVSLPLYGALYLLYPLVWLGNTIVKILLLPLKINISKTKVDELSPEELKSIVNEPGTDISRKDQEMLVGILELESVTAEDIMIPRAEIVGIDLEDNWQDIMQQLMSSQHTRLPLYEHDLNHLHGMLHLRDILHALAQGNLNKEILSSLVQENYFVPETITLNRQLLNFQKNNSRSALVVDEYGELQGLITLEDILEEVIGNFTTDISETTDIDITRQTNGSYIVDGSVTIRELNRKLKWQLPNKHAKTLNGLVTATLDGIPNVGTCVKINGYPIEVLKIKDNIIKTLKVFPRLLV